MSSGDNLSPLQRAHKLSAEAAQLLSSNPNPSRATLTRALESYREASNLFRSASITADTNTKPTLSLLENQHVKLVRDLERRLVNYQDAPSINQMTKVTGSEGQAGGRGGSRRLDRGEEEGKGRTGSEGRDSNETREGREGRRPLLNKASTSPITSKAPLGLASLQSQNNNPGIANRISSTTLRGTPPFALRPTPQITSQVSQTSQASQASQTSQFPPPSVQSNISSNPTHDNSSSSYQTSPFSPFSTKQIQGPSTSLSPLYSSASSSDPDPAESYITFGLSTKSKKDGSETDPFSRFWGKLEDKLNDISKPMLFAAAASVSTEESSVGGDNVGKGKIKGKKDAKKGKEKRTVPTSSGSDSFYLVEDRTDSGDSDSTALQKNHKTSGRSKRSPPSKKTPEELKLENDNLRASLDALAIHTSQVEKENKQLKALETDRRKALRGVVNDVRKEAEKLKMDASIISSQYITGAGPQDNGTVSGENSDITLKRLKLLEAENQSLREENEKQKASIQKYKDRFEKIKTNARAKKVAKENQKA